MRLFDAGDLYRADSIGASLGASSVAAAGSRLVGLVRGVALAWLIPQAEFGLYGVALLVVNVLLPMCSSGLYEGVMRYAPYHESVGTLRRFVFHSAILVLGLAATATAGLAVFAEPLSTALFSTAGSSVAAASASTGGGGLASLTRASLACVLSLAAFQTFLGLLKGLRMFRALGVVELTAACLFTVAALAGATCGLTTARALITIYALSCVAVVIVFYPGLVLAIRNTERPEGRAVGTDRRRPTSRLLTYSVWAAGTAVLWHAVSYYPMWYLLKVSDRETVGTFHAVRLITQLIHVGAVMLTSILAANVTRAWEHEGRASAVPRLELLTKASILLLILSASVLAIVRPAAFWLFPSAFAAGKAAYNPLILFFLIVGMVAVVTVRFNLLEKPRLVCMAWLTGAVVNVVASYLLLTPHWSGVVVTDAAALSAAAWAGVLGASATAVSCLVLVSHQGLPVLRTTVLLIVGGYALAAGWIGGVVLAAAVVVLLAETGVLVNEAERLELRRVFVRTGDR
ncbi:MAG: hypothetical protein PVI86_02705 [Phycisphaerae bacterium]|jgi:O-antigen/teichoic acid export membrane protein